MENLEAMPDENEAPRETETIQQFVRRGIQAGLSRESTFARAVQKFHNIQTSAVVSNWFKQLDLDPNYIFSVPEWHRPLLQLVFNDYQKAERAIQAQSCPSWWNCNLQMLNWRYAVDIQEVDRKFSCLVVFDLLYGERRDLEVQNFTLVNSGRSKLVVIDSRHVLLIKGSTDHRADRKIIRILLVELNLAEGRAKVLEQRMLEGHYLSFIQDAKDKSSFLLVVVHRELNGCWKGRLNNSHLEFLYQLFDASFILTNKKLKLEGNQVFGFRHDKLDGQDVIYYESTTLTAEGSRPTQIFLMQQDANVNFYDLLRSKYCWTKNACYIIQWFEKTGTNVFKCDLETRKISQVAQYDRVLPVKDFQVSDDEVLSVCTESEYKKQHTLYRFPLRQPDNLFILSFAAVRRNLLMFADQGQRDLIISRIPSELKPFANCHF